MSIFFSQLIDWLVRCFQFFFHFHHFLLLLLAVDSIELNDGALLFPVSFWPISKTNLTVIIFFFLQFNCNICFRVDILIEYETYLKTDFWLSALVQYRLIFAYHIRRIDENWRIEMIFVCDIRRWQVQALI